MGKNKNKKKRNLQNYQKKKNNETSYSFTTKQIIIISTICVIILAYVFGFSGHSSETESSPTNDAKAQAVNAALTRIDYDLRNMLAFGTRVPGSEGSKKTREYITQTLEDYDWQVEYDSFTSDTPIGSVDFTNIIADAPFDDLPSDAETQVIAAHYDSKLFEEFEFLGVTDSLLSVAMLLDFARSTSSIIKDMNPTKHLRFVFFDGEEAFKTWNATDSTYGSRHLAQLWEEDGTLSSIDVLILLDLIGTKDQQFYSYHENTLSEYKQILTLEHTLRERGELDKSEQSLFRPNAIDGSRLQDDHIPFVERGVRTLLLIPLPFPDIWHTEKDSSLDAVDWRVTKDFHYSFLHYIPHLVKCSFE